MSNTIRKIRLPSGNLAVYDVQPQHAGSPELIRQYGTHLYTKFGKDWLNVRLRMSHATDDTAQELSSLPIDYDTAPDAAWTVQKWAANLPGRWMFVSNGDGVPYRFESSEAAQQYAAGAFIGLPLDKIRVLRITEDMLPFYRQNYFAEDGGPIRCVHCGSTEQLVCVTDSIDVGVGGGGIPCEEEYRCGNCGEVIAYWAHGFFEPAFAEVLPYL